MFGHHGFEGFGRHLRHFAHRGRGIGKGHGPRGRGREEDTGGDRGRSFFGRGGGGGGRGGRRMFGPGDLKLVLLALIEEKPRHGYELIKELEQKFGGGYAPSPGSIYPTLTLLEELGHVRSSSSDGTKRLYTITADGGRYLRDNEAALNGAMARMEMAARAMSGEMPPHDLHHAMHTLKASLMFHRGEWDEAETERVRKIIEAAAEEITRNPKRE